MKPYQPVVIQLLQQLKPQSVLDAPSGGGWLGSAVMDSCQVDGIDLYAQTNSFYRTLVARDLNEGIPEEFPRYDCIVCCEGIEHLYAPAAFLQSAREHLQPGGLLIITTPNVWYPAARLQYFLRGFFPSFPNLVGKIEPGSHMHVTPWTFPQLYLILRLLGFSNITLHPMEQEKPKHVYEYLLGWPHALYCRSRASRAESQEEKAYWQMAGSADSLYGRGLVVSARV
ncbi:MAG: class I SAM-dependent methyltransferase [Magnetococcales bacterium]|nr:class I SAM-dependent methyltransferase [Magnetococcales bacterium]NGZ25791.1 class I SAM-dependent methyltransferase [Magnetococcales bacterium]